ncbi:Hemerythrin HHE cation binding domain protein [Gammaproteobacteria bacterium]
MLKTWHELLVEDHETTEKLFDAVSKACASPNGPTRPFIADVVIYLNEYVDGCHNKKEENHLFPILEQRGIPSDGGPLAVMLAEHEQSKRFLAQVTKTGNAYAHGNLAILSDFVAAFNAYATLVKTHYWKENDILFKMAQRTLTDADVESVMAGIVKTEAALGPNTHEHYHAIARRVIAAGGLEDLSFGLEREILAAMLNTLPVELSFVDANDIVRYFSHENREKIFGRTRGAIGAQVQNCHPRKSLHIVNTILADFKAGKREVAEFWLEINGKFIHIRYYPVCDSSGIYLGCLEVVQDVTGIRALTGQKRLID